MLGAIAATTSRIRFGALLTPLARRRPTKVARETVTLDHLSKGRLIFGAALGWSGTEEFEDLGEPGDARIRADKLDEALHVITALWSGEHVDHQGEHYTVRDTQFLPPPGPPIPIWIGGVWPAKRPFRRAARHDGVFPLVKGQPDTETMTPEQLATIVAYTRRHGHPRDVIIEGNSDGDRASLHDYTDLTWYIEKLGWWRGSAAETEAAIKRGPPHAEATKASTRAKYSSRNARSSWMLCPAPSTRTTCTPRVRRAQALLAGDAERRLGPRGQHADRHLDGRDDVGVGQQRAVDDRVQHLGIEMQQRVGAGRERVVGLRVRRRARPPATPRLLGLADPARPASAARAPAVPGSGGSPPLLACALRLAPVERRVLEEGAAGRAPGARWAADQAATPPSECPTRIAGPSARRTSITSST